MRGSGLCWSYQLEEQDPRVEGRMAQELIGPGTDLFRHGRSPWLFVDKGP